MAEQRPNKKVVRVTPTATATNADGTPAAPTWTPTPESKAKAVRFRIIAAVLWALAIAGEAFTIFYVLKRMPALFWLLVVAFVVIGALAIVGGQLWKKANDLDPASRQDKVRFFIQNQLGAIISVIAFLPLIILVFTNKNMDGKQKAIAGIIGILIGGTAIAANIDYNPPSVEQYSAETGMVEDITGQDLVFWTASGNVFHLCQEASAVNKESKDGKIYSGSTADAHAAGKPRLTLQLPQELKECGYGDYPLPADWKDVVEGKAPFVPVNGDTTPEDTTSTPEPDASAS